MLSTQLTLKLFSGEMIKAYESACIAKGTVQVPYPA